MTCNLPMKNQYIWPRYGVQMLMEMMALTGPGRLRTKSFLDTCVQKFLSPMLAISHHFGAHLGDQNLLIFGKIWDHVFDHFVITFGATLGPILGTKICLFLVKFGIIFLITFWSLFEPLLGSFWYPFWAQIGPRRVKTSSREPSRGSQSQNSVNPKTLKNHLFFNVLGV